MRAAGCVVRCVKGASASFNVALVPWSAGTLANGSGIWDRRLQALALPPGYSLTVSAQSMT